MQKKLFEEQIKALKKHPLIRKVEDVDGRLVKLVFSPKIESSRYADAYHQYAGQSYRIKIQLPINYPQEPPNLKFVDSIQHINICSEEGIVFMPLLGEDWSPYLSLYYVIDALNMLLCEPETNDYYLPNQDLREENHSKLNFRSKKQESPTNHEVGLQRKLKRTFSKLSVVSLIPPPLEDSSMSDLPTTPTTPPPQQKRSKLRRLKTLVQSTSNQFLEPSKGQKEMIESDKMAKHFHPSLSNIHEVSDEHHSKNFSQLLESISSPYFKNIQNNKKTMQKNSSLSNSIIKLQEVKSSQPFQLKISKTLKRDQKIIKTTRKTSSKQEPTTTTSEHQSPTLVPTLNRKFLQDISTQKKQKEVVLASTTELDCPSRQLRNINTTLNNFYKEYEELVKREQATSCQAVKDRIEKRIQAHLEMIDQLQSLSLQVKQSIVAKIKKEVRQ